MPARIGKFIYLAFSFMTTVYGINCVIYNYEYKHLKTKQNEQKKITCTEV